jgi:hypothetical protein
LWLEGTTGSVAVMPIEHFNQYNAFSEGYEVVRTVELVGSDNTRYRLDVLRVYVNPEILFTVRCYVGEHLTLQPTYPQNNSQFARHLESFEVWVHEDELPWVAEDNADDALDAGLRFLARLVQQRSVSVAH